MTRPLFQASGVRVASSLNRIRCGALAVAIAAATLPPVQTAAQDIDVVELTVEDVQAGYASGAFTAVELTRAFLSRISAYEGY
jgi:hypothetical protein